MPSFRSTSLAVAAAFVAIANADYFIEPDSVPLSTRKAWCLDEKRICPIICRLVDDRPAMVNDCDPEALTYGCICGNGQQPNISEYTLTLPYFTCTEYGNQCVLACGQNNECSRACREDNPCGAQDPAPPNKTTSTTSSTATSTKSADDEVITNLGQDSGAAQAADLARHFGLAVVLGGFFAGFALM
ncbi:unnamed protein product [Parascedosporium putredinis]|uniref:DUF7707 domain-containing protein n=1 Tax=Parascedosporium putredinis TaxID=1442378 RepID=A0A9P1ME80_9PEZI|nr:unnamed protein product [Parascedosporium putredinis]CAI8002128.1 unnamed protein product [Parascedosporium putredinis]